MFPDELSVLQIERTRVRLLFCDADFWQVVDQHLGFDLELSRQFVDANLIGFRHELLSYGSAFSECSGACETSDVSLV